MGKILMLSSSLNGQGGIATVVNIYKESGLFSRWPIYHLSTHREGTHFSKIYAFVVSYMRFLVFICRGDIDLVHAHTASRASFWRKSYFIALAKIFKVPVIFHLHGAEFQSFYYAECNSIQKRIVRWILDGCKSVVVLSSQWKTILSEITDGKKITTVFNPITTQEHTPLPHTRDNYSLLFLGRLGKRKGVYDLLEAIANLKSKYPDICLKCGGDGDLEQVKQKSIDLGIDSNLEILGWVSGEEKEALLASSTAYVLPSYNEGLPMGILEAMASGLPVVSTTVGGIPDAIDDGIEGYLLPPGNVDLLTDALDRLLHDADLRRNMGEAGRRKVESTFADKKVMPQIEAIYRELGLKPISEMN